MGRYYSGDIEGKFWFAVQSSNAADRFGVQGQTPEMLHYYFDKYDLPKLEAEIQRIEEFLGKDKQKLDELFETHGGWNDKLLKENNITEKQLSEYADLILGYKIHSSILENGQCSFDAEL
jgi:hypothetical protein